MPTVRKQLSSTAVWLVLFGGSGCGHVREHRVPPSPPPAQEVLVAFGERTANAGPKADPPPHLDLYVDASGSMQGFVGPQASGYRSALNLLLDRVASSSYEVSVFGFAERVSGPLGNVGIASFLRPGFYSGGETAFPILFDRIARRLDTGTVAVVVSDLVQSGRTGDQRSLTLAFQALARVHPSVLLLALRSAFSGRYFVEGARAGSSFVLQLDGSSPEASRPFYVLIVAPSRSGLQEARRSLLQDSGPDEELDVSQPAVDLDQAKFRKPGEGMPRVWYAFRDAVPLPLEASTPRSLHSFIERADPGPAQVSIQLRAAMRDRDGGREGSLRSPRSLSFAIDRRIRTKDRWQPAAAGEAAPEAYFGADGKTLILNYSFPRPRPFSWDLYRVRLIPGTGNLRVPSWVEGWTVLDDSLPLWGNRTLKLNLFVEAMNRSLREQVPLAEQFLMLGRGD